MNLYLVLALALGAVSAAPAAQPGLTNAVAVSRVASDRAALATRGRPLAVGRGPKRFFTANGEWRTANEIPLTGSATPRAPAFSC
jgi:hypothetical protein